MIQENKVYELMIDKMKNYPGTILGITDISYSHYFNQYKCALVLAVPHKEIISLNNYSEEKFEKVICATREQVDVIVSDFSNFF